LRFRGNAAQPFTVFLGHGTALISVATTNSSPAAKLDRAQEEAPSTSAHALANSARDAANLKLSLIRCRPAHLYLSMDEIAVTFFLIGRDNTLPLEIWGRASAAGSRRKSTLSRL